MDEYTQNVKEPTMQKRSYTSCYKQDTVTIHAKTIRIIPRNRNITMFENVQMKLE